MFATKKILAAGALFVLGLGMTAVAMNPFNASARAAATATSADLAMQRIDAAFADVRESEAAPTIAQLAVRVGKGDYHAKPGCAGEKWPNIAAECLVTHNGVPVRPVRFITIGYPVGDSSSVLLRMPDVDA
jgi:hypothetical protein